MAKKPKIRFILAEKQLYKMCKNNKIEFQIGEQGYVIEVPPWITLSLELIDLRNSKPIQLSESDLDNMPETDRKKMN